MHASSSPEVLSIRGARVHNLKNISVDIQKQRLTVITGLSGSGKSSLAFDTIFAEGQRRYVESLSSYARQFLELQEKPDVDEIHGLSPTIAIDQKSTSHNPRSTVGTMTEIYDYLRVLFARVGTLFCPDCRGEITECTVEDIVRCVEEKITDPSILLSPLVDEQKGSHKTLLIGAQQSGFTRVRFDGLLLSIEEALLLPTDKLRPHTIELVCAEMTPEALPKREILSDLVKRALEQGGGSVVIISLNTGDEWRYSQALSCSLCHRLFPRPEPRLFSFNTPHGACSECGGLGCKHVFDGEAVVTNPKLTIAQGAIQPWMRLFGQSPAMLDWLQTIGKKHGFSVHEPFGALPPSKQQIVLRGTGAQLYEYNGTKVPFKGILTQLEDRYRDTDSEHTRKELEEYMRILVCPSCSGKRLRPEALSTCIGGENIADVVAYPLDELNVLFLRWRALPLSPIKKQILERSLQEIERRLHHLLSIGLSYLTLNRSAISS